MITISYKAIKRMLMFAGGIAAAVVLNYMFGLESTVLIMGGVCGLLAASEGDGG